MKKIVPLWVLPLIIVLAIGTIGTRLSIVKTTYAINQSDRLITQMKREREQLELKSLQLKSPRKLEALARSRYQMTQPDPKQWVRLK